MSGYQERDIIIFRKIKKGNKKAFDELFYLYYKNLCNYSYYITNDKFISEEIVADVFAKIWINRKKISISQNVKSYLYKSTRNTTISYIRKNKNIFCEIEEDTFLYPAELDTSPEKNIKKEEEQRKIKNLLSVIPERSREVFILHRLNGLKYSEIADFLDISVKTVEKHITKALRILRNNYQKKN